MDPCIHSCHLVLLQHSATAAVDLCYVGGRKRMCCSSILLCSSCHPEICCSSPSLYLSVYIECSQFGMSAVVHSSWLIGLKLCHHDPAVLFFCSWYTWFKQRRCHHDRSLWPCQWQPACVCYLHTLDLSTDPSHLP